MKLLHRTNQLGYLLETSSPVSVPTMTSLSDREQPTPLVWTQAVWYGDGCCKDEGHRVLEISEVDFLEEDDSMLPLHQLHWHLYKLTNNQQHHGFDDADDHVLRYIVLRDPTWAHGDPCGILRHGLVLHDLSTLITADREQDERSTLHFHVGLGLQTLRARALDTAESRNEYNEECNMEGVCLHEKKVFDKLETDLNDLTARFTWLDKRIEQDFEGMCLDADDLHKWMEAVHSQEKRETNGSTLATRHLDMPCNYAQSKQANDGGCQRVDEGFQSNEDPIMSDIAKPVTPVTPVTDCEQDILSLPRTHGDAGELHLTKKQPDPESDCGAEANEPVVVSAIEVSDDARDDDLEGQPLSLVFGLTCGSRPVTGELHGQRHADEPLFQPDCSPEDHVLSTERSRSPGDNVDIPALRDVDNVELRDPPAEGRDRSTCSGGLAHGSVPYDERGTITAPAIKRERKASEILSDNMNRRRNSLSRSSVLQYWRDRTSTNRPLSDRIRGVKSHRPSFHCHGIPTTPEPNEEDDGPDDDDGFAETVPAAELEQAPLHSYNFCHVDFSEFETGIEVTPRHMQDDPLDEEQQVTESEKNASIAVEPEPVASSLSMAKSFMDALAMGSMASNVMCNAVAAGELDVISKDSMTHTLSEDESLVRDCAPSAETISIWFDSDTIQDGASCFQKNPSDIKDSNDATNFFRELERESAAELFLKELEQEESLYMSRSEKLYSRRHKVSDDDEATVDVESELRFWKEYTSASVGSS